MRIASVFQDFVRSCASERTAIEAIAVADEKDILLEHHFTFDKPRNIYSHTKSFMSAAVGLAIGDGLLSLDDRPADFFAEKLPADADPAIADIRLRHLLTMSSGFHRPYLMGKDRRAGTGAPDYIAYMFSQKVEAKPGAEFAYSSADSILAGRMAEKAAGKRLGAYLYERLLKPMGIGWPIWECDPEGHPVGCGGMELRISDMIKLGQLYLAEGRWKGERLLSADWVRASSRKQIDIPSEGDIWRCPYPDSYRADGAYGQITLVLPSVGLTVSIQCPESGDFEKTKQIFHERFVCEILR